MTISGEQTSDDGPSPLIILSAGAAESYVGRLGDRFAELGHAVEASFAAVGALKQQLLAGAECDLYITSKRVMDDLLANGRLQAAAVADVGWVQTGLATRHQDPVVDVSTAAAAKSALHSAREIFSPDPVRSTAGVHFAEVLDRLDVRSDETTVHTYPNGATAMRALADSNSPGPVMGCTQVTEILQTKGVTLLGGLPQPYDLTTRYQCALVAPARAPEAARQVFELLTGDQTLPLRVEMGIGQAPAGQ